MTSAAPTILTFETESAWAVILVVSLVTLPLTLLLRRLIARPGGLASGLLVASPLFLPLAAALAYQRAAFPEVAVLKPVGPALIEQPEELMHFLLLSDSKASMFVPYAVLGSPGKLLLTLALVVSSFMLIRRMAGAAMMARLIRRCTKLEAPSDRWGLHAVTGKIAESCGMEQPPEVMLLPEGVNGAFACGGRHDRILLSRDLIESLDDEEREAVLAHEIAHLAARDVQVVFGAGILRDLVAWNPIAHVAFRKLVQDREFEADKRAAQITGRPLALASGLVKACAHGCRRVPATAAPLRGRGNLTRRVDGLLALADGKMTPAPPGTLPYVMAVLMVAFVGLEAGARIAERSSTGVITLVLGAPDVEKTDVWAPSKFRPPEDPVVKAQGAKQSARPASAAKGARPARKRIPIYYEDPKVYIRQASSMALEEKHLRRWFRSMNRVAAEMSVDISLIQWELEQSWKAIPLFSRAGPVGIYRLENGLPEKRAR